MCEETLNELMDLFNEEAVEGEDKAEFIPLKDHKYVIVSKVAYLIGVAESYFGEENSLYKKDLFNQLKANKNARIIRNLCILRTSIEKSFGYLNKQVAAGHEVLNAAERISQSVVMELSNDGIPLHMPMHSFPIDYIVEINTLISDRINNCKMLFPTWLNWNYLRDIFIMPGGMTKNGAKQAAEVYYANSNCYPFKVYINWPPEENGNILLNDRKFVTLLYQNNRDEFTDISKVMDASDYVKSNIYNFIDEGDRIDIIVDCENSNVYQLISMLRALRWEGHLEKLLKIVLVDGTSTNEGWNELKKYTDIPVEHIKTERLKNEKSLVDGTVIGKTYEELYENNVDSFILLSSDSDFWTLIKMLRGKAKFLVMVEHYKCGPDLKQKLEESLVFYCYLDDFYSGEESEEMKNDMLLTAITEDLNGRSFNLKDLFKETLLNYRIDKTPVQQDQFYSKYLKTIKLVINDDGRVELKIKDR